MRKWLIPGLMILAVCGAAGYGLAKRTPITPGQYAALSQSAKNLAVYDEFRSLLDENYFDRKALRAPPMQAILDEYRLKAAAAPGTPALYFDVFVQLAQKFPHSHVGALPPPLASGSAPELVSSTAGSNTFAKTRTDSGFDLAIIRRESFDRNMIVGDVENGSLAERAGISPGWMVLSRSMNTEGNTVTEKTEFRKLTPEQTRTFESRFHLDMPAEVTLENVDAHLASLVVKHEFKFEMQPSRASFETRQLPGDVTYIRFDTFQDAKLIDAVVAAIDAAGPSGLIIDLRRNEGGRVTEIMRILGKLLGGDQYVGTIRNTSHWKNYRTEKKAKGYGGPLALLIGPVSASGAETVAAAVKDNKRGKLFGRMTNGSVLTSQEYPLPDGGIAIIPVQDFVRGGDVRIEGVGVDPDVYVLPTLEQVRAGRDPVLERALAELPSFARARSASSTLVPAARAAAGPR